MIVAAFEAFAQYLLVVLGPLLTTDIYISIPVFK